MPRYPDYEHKVKQGDTFDSLATLYYGDRSVAPNLSLYNKHEKTDVSTELNGDLNIVLVPEKLMVFAGRCLKYKVQNSDTFESISQQHYGTADAAWHINRLCGLDINKPSEKKKTLMLPKKLDIHNLQTPLTKENSSGATCILLYPMVRGGRSGGFSLIFEDSEGNILKDFEVKIVSNEETIYEGICTDGELEMTGIPKATLRVEIAINAQKFTRPIRWIAAVNQVTGEEIILNVTDNNT